MSQLVSEPLITLDQAATSATLVGVIGHPVSKQTVYNWATRGLRGAKLEALYFGGGKWRTSEAALVRFWEAAASTDQQPRKKSVVNIRSHADSMKYLAERGIFTRKAAEFLR